MKILFLLHSLGIDERLGIMLLSRILKQSGHTVTLLITERLSPQMCLEKVKQNAPDILAYSIMTGEHQYHLTVNEKIKKEYPCFSVFGGPHPTFRPEIIEHPGVDAVCRGEGDICFPQLLEKMNRDENFYQTPNFWLKKPDGTIVQNEIGPLVDNLDALPFPDRTIVYDVSPALRQRGKKMFMAMRGCPYTCSFCFNHAYNQLTRGKGEMLRYRSVDNVIAEIKSVQENHFLDRVVICDDTFLLKPPGWLEEFSEKYAREIAIPLICNLRSDLVTEPKVKILKQMKCENVIIGVDPPDPEVAEKILQRKITSHQTISACRLFRQYGIKVCTQNLLGLPVTNPLETAYSTLQLNIQLKPYLALAHLLYPYPGTDIERIATEKNMFPPGHEKTTPSNQMDTALIYDNPKTKAKIISLTKLFGLVVQFPWLRPLTPLLISLPLQKMYTQMFYVFWGYKMFKQSRRHLVRQAVHSYLPFYFKNILHIEKKEKKTGRQ